jgi:hypothetical protein
MLTLTLVLSSLLLAPQTAPAPATACSFLTAAEVASLIGPAKALPITSAPTGSTCMFQNGDKVITVLSVKRDSDDALTGQFEAKKRVAAAQAVAGWPVPAYSATVDTPKDHIAIVGVAKNKTFVEAKVMDITQKAADLSTRLLAVMKSAAGRM